MWGRQCSFGCECFLNCVLQHCIYQPVRLNLFIGRESELICGRFFTLYLRAVYVPTSSLKDKFADKHNIQSLSTLGASSESDYGSGGVLRILSHFLNTYIHHSLLCNLPPAVICLYDGSHVFTVPTCAFHPPPLLLDFQSWRRANKSHLSLWTVGIHGYNPKPTENDCSHGHSVHVLHLAFPTHQSVIKAALMH